eukprot:9810557-Alexandrium_andersonii.AAC.1
MCKPPRTHQWRIDHLEPLAWRIYQGNQPELRGNRAEGAAGTMWTRAVHGAKSKVPGRPRHQPWAS